ncbi:hypothetical protein [Thiomicrospira sp.]|uniref:hypothetical protein n=1 Tax=Thiomicrospira sp. TaxID=935 RepID=UPI002F91DF7C
MVSLKHFQKLMFVLVFAFNSAVVNAMTPEQMAKGAFNNLKGQTGQSVLGNMGISGSGQGNIGSGKGGLNISQTATGSISCPFSEDVYGFGTVNGVSFACQQSVSGRSLYYCTNTLSGAICGDDDFKPMQTVKTDGEATMMLQSCASDGCSIKVDIKRKQTFDGNNLDSHGQSALSQNYANENSIASLTLGSGVYDDQGNVIHAGKNSNMGKYQETLLSKDQQIDCAQRQFNEIESDGETGTCARPDVPVNVFDIDSSQSTQCQDVSQCLDMVISQISEQKTCTLSIPSDTIEQNDLTPYITCSHREVYTCTESNEYEIGCSVGVLSNGECLQQSCTPGQVLSHKSNHSCPSCWAAQWAHHQAVCVDNARIRVRHYWGTSSTTSWEARVQLSGYPTEDKIYNASPLSTLSVTGSNMGSGCTYRVHYTQNCNATQCSAAHRLESTCNANGYTLHDTFAIPVTKSSPTLVPSGTSRVCS